MDRLTDYKNLVFSRRSFILVILACFFALGLIIRLFFLQVLNSKIYRTLSEKNRIKFFLLEPKRGFIKDRDGSILAESREKKKNRKNGSGSKHWFDSGAVSGLPLKRKTRCFFFSPHNLEKIRTPLLLPR